MFVLVAKGEIEVMGRPSSNESLASGLEALMRRIIKENRKMFRKPIVVRMFLDQGPGEIVYLLNSMGWDIRAPFRFPSPHVVCCVFAVVTDSELCYSLGPDTSEILVGYLDGYARYSLRKSARQVPAEEFMF
jgi:hypothetical protein